MALFKFTREILAGRAIPVFDNGRVVRDFTYIDDVVEATVRVLANPPPDRDSGSEEEGEMDAPYRIFNIGSNRPVGLLDYIRVLEASLGRQATLDLLPMQSGDVAATMADVSRLGHDNLRRGGRQTICRLVPRSLWSSQRPMNCRASQPQTACRRSTDLAVEWQYLDSS
jgi:nucleoside-diphosphate-sugar epimerase